jgi:hypothetical protein
VARQTEADDVLRKNANEPASASQCGNVMLANI